MDNDPVASILDEICTCWRFRRQPVSRLFVPQRLLALSEQMDTNLTEVAWGKLGELKGIGGYIFYRRSPLVTIVNCPSTHLKQKTPPSGWQCFACGVGKKTKDNNKKKKEMGTKKQVESKRGETKEKALEG